MLRRSIRLHDDLHCALGASYVKLDYPLPGRLRYLRQTAAFHVAAQQQANRQRFVQAPPQANWQQMQTRDTIVGAQV